MQMAKWKAVTAVTLRRTAMAARLAMTSQRVKEIAVRGNLVRAISDFISGGSCLIASMESAR